MIRGVTKLITRRAGAIESIQLRAFGSHYNSREKLMSKDGMVKFPKVGHKIGHNIEKETAGDVIDSSTELQKYVQKVTRTTGSYLGITAASGAATVGGGYVLASYIPVDMLMTGGMVTMGGAFLTSLWAAWKIGSVEPKYKGKYMTYEKHM